MGLNLKAATDGNIAAAETGATEAEPQNIFKDVLEPLAR